MLGAGGDALERRVRKLEKDRTTEPTVMMVRLRELFSQSVRSVPPRMLEEFFLQLVDRYSGENFDKEAFYDRLYAAADLFSCDYDDRENILSFEEWKLAGELVSDYGVDIDDDTLTYIMSRVVEHGAL